MQMYQNWNVISALSRPQAFPLNGKNLRSGIRDTVQSRTLYYTANFVRNRSNWDASSLNCNLL